MAILRAGPWWENGSIDPINPVTDPNGAPVNIARGDWPNQTWAARSLLTNEVFDQPNGDWDEITTWGTAALGEAVTVSSNLTLAEARLTFAYQATESFTITVDYESYVQDDDPGASFYWNYSTFSGSDDWFDTGGTTTRTQTVTLPATTLGFFSAGTLIYYPAQSTATVTIS